MADDDDDSEEFARFLEEDDDSTSMSTSFQHDTRAAAASTSDKRKTFGSAFAVTAAAAALLASSKLLSASGASKTAKKTGSSSSKKKPKDKSSSSSKASKKNKSAVRARSVYDSNDDGDDEEPPPSYSASQRTGLDADPYAFDLDTSFHLEQDDGDDDDRSSKKKKKTKATREPKDRAKAKTRETVKRETKPALSIEDRVAQILKRTGSNSAVAAPQAIDERASNGDSSASDKDDAGDGRVKQTKAESAVVAVPSAAERKDALDASNSSSDDPKRLSLSDSLGMESADFEVGAHAKRKLEQSRFSLASSLNSDKFAVNTDALDESEQTNARYATQTNDLFAASRFTISDDDDRNDDDDADDATDDYGDDGFELDQTTVGAIDLARLTTYTEASLGKSDSVDTTSFVSQFDKMKGLFSVDASVDAAAIGVNDSLAVSNTDGEDRDGEAEAVEPTDGNYEDDTFGYEDEDFENDEQGDQTLEKERSDALEAVEKVTSDPSPDPQDVAESTTDAASELPSWYLRPLPADVESASLESLVNNGEPVQSAIETAGVVPREQNGDESANQVAEHVTTASAQASHALAPAANDRDVVLESPPMSPPPPPPPDDEDDEDDMHSFTLGERALAQPQQLSYSTYEDASTTNKHVTTAQQPSQDRAVSSQPAAVIDRFQHLQTHVSTLRIITAPQSQTQQQQLSAHRDGAHNTVALQRAQRQRQPSARGVTVPPTWTTPPPLDLESESKEIDDFLRHSRQRKHARQQLRASVTKETELALRLQHAQRQILQLKRHIQASGEDDEDDDCNDDSDGGEHDRSVESDGDLHGGGDDDPSAVPVSDQVTTTLSDSVTDRKTTAARSSRLRTPRKSLRPDDPATRAVSAAELATMRKEMQTQETLIQAFQKENEQLMRQVKTLQRSAHFDLHVENEQLRTQVRTLRDQLESHQTLDSVNGDGSTTASKAQYRAAVEARLHAEAQTLVLQDELTAARAAHQARENELTLALERVKKAKVDLECRYEGLDLVKLADESAQVKTLQSDLVRVKRESELALASLQKKLDWYVENQRLLDAQDAELERLRAEVQRLSADNEQLQQAPSAPVASTPGKSPGKRSQQHHHRSAADIRRISELESRVVEMEEAMRRRHPDSLVNLILASKRADDESTVAAMTAYFAQQLDAKDRELEQLQATHETKLASFRQQQEKLVLLFQKRIRAQDKQLQSQRHGPSTKRTSGSTTVDDDEVKRVRTFYAAKLKEMEKKWDAKYRALKKQSTSDAGPVATSSSTTTSQTVPQRTLQGLLHADTTAIITNLQRELRERDALIQTLSSHVRPSATPAAQATDSVDHNANDAPRSSGDRRTINDLETHIRSVEAQLQASEDARAHLVETLSTLQTFTVAQQQPVPSPRSDEKPTVLCNDDAQALETAKDLVREQLTTKFTHEIAALTAAHRDELTRAQATIAALEAQVRDHTKVLETHASIHAQELEQLQQQLSRAEEQSRELQGLADAVPALERKVAQLHEQLAVPRTPSMVQYRSLEMKIETLMQKHLLREAELKVLLAKATQSSELEKLQLERVHQSAIAAKNVEIRHFQKQLAIILSELELLRQPQAP